LDPIADINDIFSRALDRVNPYKMIANFMSLQDSILTIQSETVALKENLLRYNKIYVLGIGKASSKMALAIEHILGTRITGGSVITKYGHAEKLHKINAMEAGHPIPDENSLKGARLLYETARDADENTLIINLVSGGGSALFSLPREGISLADMQQMTKILLDCGADIKEINCIRKHISQVKGGNFARISYPARMINIILSDVIGDRLDTIASGITVADKTTFIQAQRILRKYQIEDKIPLPIKRIIESGVAGKIPDTPKEGDPVFTNVSNILLGNNLVACKAARARGEELGYKPIFITASLSGEAREIARFYSSIAKEVDQNNSDLKKPALIIAGGETTVTIKGDGKGGRNQEMVLAFLIDLIESYEDFSNIYFLSAGTDGQDGPTDAAGAIVSFDVKSKIDRQRLDPWQFLENNDSYHFFEKTGNLYITGPTNTNVCDMQLLIVS